jgi:hypothetical protein
VNYEMCHVIKSNQGSLTEGKGSVLLTSSLRLVDELFCKIGKMLFQYEKQPF